MTLFFSQAKLFALLLICALLFGCASQPNSDIAPKQPVVQQAMTAADQQLVDQLLGDFVDIAPGSFSMGDIRGSGDTDELPVHTVAVSAFAINRYEVTFEQYDLFARMTGNEQPKDRWGRGRRPVMDITWHDAMEFAEWLSAISGEAIRLPTEAEWEYAARAGSDNNFSFGNDSQRLCEYANIADQTTTIGWRNKTCSDTYRTTAPVGSLKPNAFGLYDMHGNVWEWLNDCWVKDYRKAPTSSLPLAESDCSKRAQRGGSWFYGSEEARVSYRAYGNDLDKSVTLGFRLVREVPKLKR